MRGLIILVAANNIRGINEYNLMQSAINRGKTLISN